MKAGDYLICKKTHYEGDFYKKNNLKNKILNNLKTPRWIKDKTYHIHQLDEYTNEFGNYVRCYLLECEPFVLGRKRTQVFIYDNSVQKIFYSEQEIRKLKLQQLEDK